MKKKKEFFKNPAVIVSCFVLMGATGTAIVTLAQYITLPTRVEAVEQKTDKIEEYIQKQQIYNDLLNQSIQQKQEDIISPDGKFFMENGQWKPIKLLKEK